MVRPERAIREARSLHYEIWSGCKQDEEDKMSIWDIGEHFEVICKRCNKRFWVIRNWGGGIRRQDKQKINPAKCDCGSRVLEVF